MGYCGLDNVIDSDVAADLLYDVSDAVAKALSKGLKVRENGINTDGPVNVALVFEDSIIGTHMHSENLVSVARKTASELEKIVENTKQSGVGEEEGEWDTEKNKSFHLKAYKRMLASMNKWLKEND